MKTSSYNWGGRKNCQVISHSLGTPHHQALGQVVNGNVKQISKTFGICKLVDFEKNRTLIENNLIILQNGKGIIIHLFLIHINWL